MENKMLIKVYVKINENNEITDIISNIFLKDTSGWLFLDEGYGDKFAHAQTSYFEKPIMNEDGSFNYKFNK